MSRRWTFGQKVGGGFAIIVLLAALIAAVSTYALRMAVASKDRVLEVNARNLIDAARLEAAIEWTVAAFRGFLFEREGRFLDSMATGRAQVANCFRELRRHGDTDSEESRRMLEQIEQLEAEHQEALDRLIAIRKTDGDLATVVRLFDEEALPRRDSLRRLMHSFVAREGRLLERAKRASSDAASSAALLVIAIAIAAVLGAIAVALLLTRTLAHQVASAVQHIQSSSAELQAAANQQATGAREQASAVSEITTTISELLVTSRQIAESAQRVAQIAQETASSAHTGDSTAQRAHESLGGIKRQVDLIVIHMLDLGKKSQQIGGILEIINELAEQTNILAINASIEAAGAGDSGKRFSIVAEEIRKLADRVGGSTKEIRVLIEEIRAAVNATVMTTEGGTKAVDAGARQFAEVTTSLAQIAGLVNVTTEAAREIELSTKQQSTAVEQVNLAISNVGQATRETEASSSQTLLTATQLTGLSRELSKLVQPTAD